MITKISKYYSMSVELSMIGSSLLLQQTRFQRKKYIPIAISQVDTESGIEL